jgi:hypothetical protein
MLRHRLARLIVLRQLSPFSTTYLVSSIPFFLNSWT